MLVSRRKGCYDKPGERQEIFKLKREDGFRDLMSFQSQPRRRQLRGGGELPPPWCPQGYLKIKLQLLHHLGMENFFRESGL